MRLSTKGRFAVTAMIDVALRENSGPVPLSDIGVRHQISMSYLEQIFSKLRQHGLVRSTRGPGGGYALGQRSDTITVADIVKAIEEEDSTGSPRQKASAARDKTEDTTQDLWDTLNSKMMDYMQSITLRSLAVAQRAKGMAPDEAPSIKRGVFKQTPREAPLTNAPNSVFALGQSLLARS